MISRRFTSNCVLFALVALLLASPTWAADVPYAEGDVIEIKGVVTDASGTPQAGKTVELEAYRRAFSFNPRKMGKTKKGLVQRTVTTDADGRYALQWQWYDYFNRFELTVGDFGSEGYQVLERTDLSRRILRGSPMIVSFVLGAGAATSPGTDTTPSSQTGTTPPPRTDTATPIPAPERSQVPLTSTAQSQIRDRQGEPDLVENLDLPYGRETTWWYFDIGRAYRFLDGELRDEMTFNPVRPD